MIAVALINNLPEMIVVAVFTGVAFYGGYRFGRWRGRKPQEG